VRVRTGTVGAVTVTAGELAAGGGDEAAAVDEDEDDDVPEAWRFGRALAAELLVGEAAAALELELALALELELVAAAADVLFTTGGTMAGEA